MMYSEINISMLRQYIFCPRIIYFEIILGLKTDKPFWVQDGTDYHLKQQELMKNRTLKRFNLDSGEYIFDKYLKSSAHSLLGKVDLIIKSGNSYYPVEFKYNSNLNFSHIIQLTGYSILIEEHYNTKCRIGFILYGKKGKTERIDIKDEYLIKTIQIYNEIQTILERSRLPESNADINKCSQCEYLTYCNDRNY